MTKEEINAWVGGEIKAWREAQGWTRYQLSKHSGVQEIYQHCKEANICIRPQKNLRITGPTTASD